MLTWSAWYPSRWCGLLGCAVGDSPGICRDGARGHDGVVERSDDSRVLCAPIADRGEKTAAPRHGDTQVAAVRELEVVHRGHLSRVVSGVR
jgi:hypothetical protein